MQAWASELHKTCARSAGGVRRVLTSTWRQSAVAMEMCRLVYCRRVNHFFFLFSFFLSFFSPQFDRSSLVSRSCLLD